MATHAVRSPCVIETNIYRPQYVDQYCRRSVEHQTKNGRKSTGVNRKSMENHRTSHHRAELRQGHRDHRAPVATLGDERRVSEGTHEQIHSLGLQSSFRERSINRRHVYTKQGEIYQSPACIYKNTAAILPGGPDRSLSRAALRRSRSRGEMARPRRSQRR